MKTTNLYVMLLVGSSMACGTPSQPEARMPSPAVQQESPVVEEPVEEQQSEQEMVDDDDHIEPTLPPHDPPRPPCHTLDRDRCPVSPGCVWYAKGSVGECRDE